MHRDPKPYPELPSVLLSRMETRWHKPWLVGALSHWGQGHADKDIPNQDAFATGHEGPATWLAVADGVSAASAGGEGAEFVTREAGKELSRVLAKSDDFRAVDMNAVVETVRQRLVDAVAARGLPLQDFATTLLLAVLNGPSITVAKLGDGYVLGVERSRDRARLVSLAEAAQPRHGSEVVPITAADWKKALQVRHIADREAAGIDTVALATDGCDRFFAKTEKGAKGTSSVVLNPDFLDTHLHQNLGKLGARNLFVYLANLMGHPQFVDEGDDRTLVFATARTNGTAS